MTLGGSTGSVSTSNSASKEELTAILPEKNETKVADSITVGTGGVSDPTVENAEDTEKEETEELSEEEKMAAEEEQKTAATNVVVEDEVAKIREKYNTIVSGISAGTYSKVNLESGKTAYYDDSALVAVIINKNVDGSAYSKSYYYDNQKLVFAYYEGSDAHRFYFYGDQLMRWRYSQNASNAQDAVNHDWETTSEYQKWVSEVWSDGMSYM